MSDFSPAEPVYIENEWYDGPRAGIASIYGKPHRFVSQFDEDQDQYLGSFLVWPIEECELTLEQEQWRIFVNWNDEYEAGRAGTDSHPAQPGLNQRWGELDLLLKASREMAPSNAIRARAQMVHLQDQRRYTASGPSYLLSWQSL